MGLTQFHGVLWKLPDVTRSTHTGHYRQLVATLADARRRSGLTQQQVADRLGKPQSYVAKVEGSERRIDLVEFALLAKAIGEDPVALFKDVLSAMAEPADTLDSP